MAKQVPENRPLVEVYVHTFQGKVQSVDVAVRIDYANGKISLIEPKNLNGQTARQYIFSNREVEYMAGWQDVLDGLKSAVTDATTKLKAYQKDTMSQVGDAVDV